MKSSACWVGALVGLLLHAATLTVPHPLTNEPLTFHSPCPF